MKISELLKAPFKIFAVTFFSFISIIITLCFFGLLFAGAGFGLESVWQAQKMPDAEDLDYSYLAGDKKSENFLLALTVEGVILGSPSLDIGSSLGWMGVTYGYELQDTLEKAAKNDKIKGIFLHLQTPGGTIYGSKAILDGIKSYQKAAKKPVLAYIEGISASGGVMAMVGADAIYADYGSMIGSIGVIGGAFTYFDKPTATQGGLFGGGIVTQGGIEHTIISAGRGKDLGNPFRRPTDEELQTLQKGINIEYENFVSLVAKHRSIEPSVIRDKMGAQIFDNQTAQTYGLIDGTLNRNSAIAQLAKLAKVGKNFQLVSAQKDRRKLWQELLMSFQKGAPPEARQKQAVRRDICTAVSRVPMAYHGNLTELCAQCSEDRIWF